MPLGVLTLMFCSNVLSYFSCINKVIQRILLHLSLKVMSHYENMPVQYTAIFHGCKNGNFQMKNCDIFSYFCSKHRSWVHVRTASVRRF